MLTRCTIRQVPVMGGNRWVLFLPAQFDRADYVKIDKILKNFGGKWDRKVAGHVFAGDPRADLGMAAEAGAYVDRRQELQFFPTPPSLADRMARMASVGTGCMVLEPSAGHGAIAFAVASYGAHVEARTRLEADRRAQLVAAITAYFAERMSHTSLQLTLDRLQIRGTVDGQGLVAEDYARRPAQWLAFDRNGQVVERKEWPAARKVRLRQAGER